MTESTLEVLISTIDERIRSVEALLRPVTPGVRYLVTHQQRTEDDAAVRALKQRMVARGDVRVLDTATRGLSRSRNLGLAHAEGDLVVLADDDVHYAEGAFEAVRTLFAAEPDLDVATLQAHAPGGAPLKRYPARAKRHDRLSILSVSSIEIVARRASLARARIAFDERFGLGSEFPASEEVVFLADCLDAGLLVGYRPRALAVHPAQSTGSRWSDPAVVASKGPLFQRVYGWKGYPLFLAFALAKWPRYRCDESLGGFIAKGTRALLRARRSRQ